jgi:hypothetical protein
VAPRGVHKEGEEEEEGASVCHRTFPRQELAFRHHDACARWPQTPGGALRKVSHVRTHTKQNLHSVEERSGLLPCWSSCPRAFPLLT